MAANVGSGDERMEVNLTPLLDVILQLIMFFMMCINFVSDQVNQNVVLPASASAQEIMPKTDIDVLVINIEVARRVKRDSSGAVIRDPRTGDPVKEMIKPRQTKIVFTGQEEVPFFTDDQEGTAMSRAQRALHRLASFYKRKQALDEERRTGKRPPLSEVQLKTVVVIRADAETRYGLVVQLIAQCTKEGFAKVELRALSQNQPS